MTLREVAFRGMRNRETGGVILPKVVKIRRVNGPGAVMDVILDNDDKVPARKVVIEGKFLLEQVDDEVGVIVVISRYDESRGL